MIETGRTQVRSYHGEVHVFERTNGLQLDDHLLPYHEIHAVKTDRRSLVTHDQRLFSLELQTAPSQLNAQGVHVNRLQETGTQIFVYFDRGSDDPVAQFLLLKPHGPRP